MAGDDADVDAWVRRRSARPGGGAGAPNNGGTLAAVSSSAAFAPRRPGAFPGRARVPAAEEDEEETQQVEEMEDANDDDDDDDDDDDGEEDEGEEEPMTQDILADTPESPPTPPLPAAGEPTADSAAITSPPPPPNMVTLTSPTTMAVSIPPRGAAESVGVVPARRRQPLGVRDAVSLSPVDTPAVSGEDDDYRSETSSEVSTSRGSRPRKNIVSACSDHRDLSKRLRQAVHNSADAIGFDETLVGADVVLCVRRRKSDLARRARLPRHSDSDDDDDEMTEVPPPSPDDGAPEIQRFYAHRFMLAASSAPFKAMLTGRMRESSEREVKIHGIAAPIVEKMLLFIYTGGTSTGRLFALAVLYNASLFGLYASICCCQRSCWTWTTSSDCWSRPRCMSWKRCVRCARASCSTTRTRSFVTLRSCRFPRSCSLR
jgi:hypothetical protein